MLVSADPGLGDRAVVPAHRRRDPDDRPGLRDPVELLVAVAPAVAELRHPHLDQHLVRRERRLQVVDEEVRRRHRAPAAAAGDDELGVQRERHRRQVAGRVGVRERAAEGAAVPDRGVGDRLGRLGEQPGSARRTSGSWMTSWCVVIAPMTRWSPSSRTPRISSTRPTSTTTSGYASRSRSSGISDWPPASTLASSPCSRERGDRLVDRAGPHVVELRRDHCAPPAVVVGRARRRTRPCLPRPGHRPADAGLVDRPPDPLGRARHPDVVDAELPQRVDDRVDHGRRRRDGAGLADALDAQRVRGRRRLGPVGRRRTAGRARPARGSRPSCRSPGCRRRRRPPPRRAPARCPARSRRAPGPRRSSG